MECVFYINNEQVLKCKIDVSWQGQSSIGAKKKNYSFDFTNANGKSLKIKFGDWICTDGFHAKGYFIDPSQTHDIGTYRLWRKMIGSLDYPDCKVSNMPFSTSTTSSKSRYTGEALYAPDGFPLELLVNGDFEGLYTLRLKKTRENYALDNSNLNHIYLDSNSHPTLFSTYNLSEWDVKSPKMSGYVEGASTLPVKFSDVQANIERLFSFTSDLANQYVNHAQYINLAHWMTWFLLVEIVYDNDHSGNNYNVMTWDGKIWSIIPYDFDATLRSGEAVPQDQNFVLGNNTNDIWQTFYTVFNTEIKAQYAKLRRNQVITIANCAKIFCDIQKNIPASIYEKDIAKWQHTSSFSSVDQIWAFFRDRLNYLDTRYGYTGA